EFWQYRPLADGESAARVDWRRSARSDDLFVREREREDRATLHLWVDEAPTMDFASNGGRTKREYASLLCAALAVSVIDAGELVVLKAQGIIRDGLDLLRPAKPGRDVPASRGDVAIIASDWLADDTKSTLRRLSDLGVTGVALVVADPAECDYTLTGTVSVDALNGTSEPRRLDKAEAVSDQYFRAWCAHLHAVEEAARGVGWGFLFLRTDAAPADSVASLAAMIGRQ
ncbi:MAG: DUF58 domain-containing protein, partial [Pacificimonas sp.]